MRFALPKTRRTGNMARKNHHGLTDSKQMSVRPTLPSNHHNRPQCVLSCSSTAGSDRIINWNESIDKAIEACFRSMYIVNNTPFYNNTPIRREFSNTAAAAAAADN